MDFVHDVNGTVGFGANTTVQTWDYYKRYLRKSTQSPNTTNVTLYANDNLTTYNLQK